MDQGRQRPEYRVFLLRMWEERLAAPQAPVASFSLEDATGRERRCFVDLDALTAYLATLFASPPDAAAEPDDRH